MTSKPCSHEFIEYLVLLSISARDRGRGAGSYHGVLAVWASSLRVWTIFWRPYTVRSLILPPDGACSAREFPGKM